MKRSELKQIIKEVLSENRDENLLSKISQSLNSYLRSDPYYPEENSSSVVIVTNNQGTKEISRVLNIINDLGLKIVNISHIKQADPYTIYLTK